MNFQDSLLAFLIAKLGAYPYNICVCDRSLLNIRLYTDAEPASTDSSQQSHSPTPTD